MMNHSSNFSGNHGINAEASADSLSVMMEKELTTYSCGDYLNPNGKSQDDCIDVGGDEITDNIIRCGSKITADDREKIVDWCYAIVDRCKFDRETVAVAMNIVDRFMSTNSSSSQVRAILYDREQYQLVAVTALYICIKIHERDLFGSKDFAAACRGIYSVEDIEDMEWKILQGLSWRLCPPTSLQVANRILSLMLHKVLKETTLEQGTWDFIQDEVAFHTENAVRDYFFTTVRPSTLAAAAIVNVIDQVNDQDYEHLMVTLIHVLKEFNFVSPTELMKTRDQLHRLLDENDDIASDVDSTASSDTCYNDSKTYPDRIQDEIEVENEPLVNRSSPKTSPRSFSMDRADRHKD